VTCARNAWLSLTAMEFQAHVPECPPEIIVGFEMIQADFCKMRRDAGSFELILAHEVLCMGHLLLEIDGKEAIAGQGWITDWALEEIV
jgi:hypothetical protein